MHQLASTSDTHPVCYEVQQQTTSVCATSTGPPFLGSRLFSLSMENLVPCAFPPVAILGKVVTKLQSYPCRRIMLIALVTMSNSITLCLHNLPNLLAQHLNQAPCRNLSNLNLYVWLLEPQLSKRKEVTAKHY